MFQALMDRIDEEILRWIFLYQAVMPEEEAPPAAPQARPVRGPAPPPPVREREPELALAGARTAPRNLSFNNPSEAPSAFERAEPDEAKGGGDSVQTVRREGKKVGRNDPCPCGSGRKYKKCHGAG
jgi:preprotein translocase subunit SecA